MRADLDNSLDAYELYNDKYKELNDHYLSKVRQLQSEMSKRNEEFQQLSRQITNSGAPSSDQDQAVIMRELVVSLSKLIAELEKKEDFLPPPQ
jgi:vacuolar-type H+-ATPase catalytic subunit A/Vma1